MFCGTLVELVDMFVRAWSLCWQAGFRVAQPFSRSGAAQRGFNKRTSVLQNFFRVSMHGSTPCRYTLLSFSNVLASRRYRWSPRPPRIPTEFPQNSHIIRRERNKTAADRHVNMFSPPLSLPCSAWTQAAAHSRTEGAEGEVSWLTSLSRKYHKSHQKKVKLLDPNSGRSCGLWRHAAKFQPSPSVETFAHVRQQASGVTEEHHPRLENTSSSLLMAPTRAITAYQECWSHFFPFPLLTF